MQNNERLEEIQRMFDLATIEDRWDMEGPMLYSFFFVSTDPDKLDKLAEIMEEQGLDPLDIFQLGDEDTEEPTGEYLLHVDQMGVHTPESLDKQLEAFEKLCDETGYGEFDGWEFGKEEDDEEDESEMEGVEED